MIKRIALLEHRAERKLQSAWRIEQSVRTKKIKLSGEFMKSKFRFQDLDIWKLAIEIANELFDIADELERNHLFRFAEQLRGAGMSMSNNIAEGSGSEWKKEFKNFLNIARRSAFENANILILLNGRKLIADDIVEQLLDKLDKECRMITNFKKAL